jgi:hypothetical protein
MQIIDEHGILVTYVNNPIYSQQMSLHVTTIILDHLTSKLTKPMFSQVCLYRVFGDLDTSPISHQG